LFRVKIALLSILLSGSILVGMGLYSLSVMNKVAMDRIDREILALGEGHLATRPSRDYWQNFASSLRFIYGEEHSEKLIVQIKDAGNEILFKSPHWPAAINEDSFPGFDRTMDDSPPRDSQEVREGGTDRYRRDGEGQQRRDMRGGRDKREGREDPDGRGIKVNRRGPPPEAYEACAGRKEGMTAQFVDHRGETISGTCEKENGNLVLRPDFRRQNRQARGDVQVQNSTIDSQERTQGEHPLPSRNESNSPRGVTLPRIKKKPVLGTIQTTSDVWRAGIMGSDRITIMIGVNMAGFHEDEARYRMAFLGIIPVAMLLLAGGGWLIAQRALKPVALITRTAEGITASGLSQRVPLIDADSELARLVEVINGMLDRLEKSFGQAIRFSADAAHELQTPLTILQGELDDALQHAAAGSEEQQRYGGLLEEVQRLKAIVQKLLILARADAGRLELRLEAVDLSALLEAAAEDAEAVAMNMQIEKQIDPGITVQADPVLIGQAVWNLVSNALKYNHENGLIRFRLSASDNKANITISNTGTPIPREDREKIFSRFYRIDQSRNKTVYGSGLGLSLAREIAHAHHGKLNLESDFESTDLISFTLSLPCNLS
jgi:heavy metal sensor kinase